MGDKDMPNVIWYYFKGYDGPRSSCTSRSHWQRKRRPYYEFVVSAPKLSSFTYNGMTRFRYLPYIFTQKSVNFQTIHHRSLKKPPKFFELTINTFQQLHKTDMKNRGQL
ncbi:hypothetical protein Hanom_Chr13g01185821 [Helianthus anomalus]